jgi:hypothetical protein
MKRMILNAQEAERGVESYAVAFENLGLNAAEYVKLSPDEQFLALADAVKHSEDQMKTHAAILRLMGTRGSELIPMLKEGSAGINDMTRNMKILSDEGVRSIEETNDAWNKLVTDMQTKSANFAVNVGNIWTNVRDSILVAMSMQADFMGAPEAASWALSKTKAGKEWDAGLRERAAAARRSSAGGGAGGGGDAPRPKIRMPWLRQQTRADKFMSGLGVQFAGLDAMVNMQKTSGNFRGRLNDPVFGQNAASIRAASADAWVARNKKKDEDNLKTIADNTQRTAAVLESL